MNLVKIKKNMSYFLNFFSKLFYIVNLLFIYFGENCHICDVLSKKFKSRLIFVNKSLLCGFFTSSFHQWLLFCVLFIFQNSCVCASRFGVFFENTHHVSHFVSTDDTSPMRREIKQSQ